MADRLGILDNPRGPEAVVEEYYDMLNPGEQMSGSESAPVALPLKSHPSLDLYNPRRPRRGIITIFKFEGLDSC